MSAYYPVSGLPVQFARELLAKPLAEDALSEALRAAYATGFTQAVACLEPDPEWDGWDGWGDDRG